MRLYETFLRKCYLNIFKFSQNEHKRWKQVSINEKINMNFWEKNNLCSFWYRLIGDFFLWLSSSSLLFFFGFAMLYRYACVCVCVCVYIYIYIYIYIIYYAQSFIHICLYTGTYVRNVENYRSYFYVNSFLSFFFFFKDINLLICFKLKYLIQLFSIFNLRIKWSLSLRSARQPVTQYTKQTGERER